MKKYSLLVAITAILLTACSVSNRVNDGSLVLKRKYNKGYFVADKEDVSVKSVNGHVSEEMTSIPTIKSNWSYTDGLKPFVNLTETNSFIASTNGVANKTVSKKLVQSKEIVEQINQKLETSNYVIKPQHRVKIGLRKRLMNLLMEDVDQTLLIVLCFFAPPLAVYLKQNDVTNDFIINIILTCLCGIPGIIHALIIVLKK